jgi:hypothetical protein
MGVIVCGYQGIGKSTVAKEIPNVIDLESSCFYGADEETRPEDWAYFYVKIAIDQALRGNDVFLSCHESVREQLYLQYYELCDEDRTYVAPLVIIPAVELKEEWGHRLLDRYLLSREPKDKRAYEFHIEKFETNVNKPIYNTLLPLPTILIRDINYDLRALIYDYLNYADDKYNCSIIKWRKRGIGGHYDRRSEVCPES